MDPIKGRLVPAATFVLRFLPHRVAVIAATLAGDLSFLLQAARRQVVLENLERTAPDATTTERRQLARATFRNFALMWLDFLRLPLLGRDALADLIRWKSRENLDAALRQGNGAIIVTAHLGGVDLAGVYFAALGYPVAVIVEDTAESMFQAWRRYIATTGIRLVSRRHGTVAAYRALRSGALLAVYIDRLIEGEGLEVDFCGGRRMLPLGTARYAHRLQSPIVVGSIARRKDAPGYELITEPPLDPRSTPEDLTRSVASALTRVVRAYPDQWFVFQRGWVDQAGGHVASVEPAWAGGGDGR
jgi:KDO2-lipid IV(A) lauroyltransferase